uniref:Uncharacterized protein n=1 Tax=Picea sitchensis TaxID=3332 RepID=B8LMM6_PICSI|nr:unknown [Picea sitchensis]
MSKKMVFKSTIDDERSKMRAMKAVAGGLYRSQQGGGKDNCRGRNRSCVSRKKIKEIGVQSRAAERRSCQGREKGS